MRPLSSLVAHEDVCDGDLEAEVAVPAAVELDVAEALVEVEEAQHPLGRHHVLLVHHHHEVAAADVGEVVLPPLLVLFVMWLIRGVKFLAVLLIYSFLLIVMLQFMDDISKIVLHLLQLRKKQTSHSCAFSVFWILPSLSLFGRQI